MTPARLRKIIRSVQREFKPAQEQQTSYTYDIVSHNGNHFSTALALALGVDPPPASLNALANTANMAANCVEIKILRCVAIDATPARWSGDAGSSQLDGASTAASSPGNE
jgi:hypothetical protein